MTSTNDNLAAKAARGEYVLTDPLDYLILEKLHEEGELFAGIYPVGDTASAIGKKFDQVKGGLDSQFITNRLRTLRIQGLVTKLDRAPGSGGNSIWQRTASGKKVYLAWKESRNGNS